MVARAPSGLWVLKEIVSCVGTSTERTGPLHDREETKGLDIVSRAQNHSAAIGNAAQLIPGKHVRDGFEALFYGQEFENKPRSWIRKSLYAT